MAGTNQLSGRERQIMDAVFAQGEATATQVLEAMTEPPTRDAVRTFLRILEGKGHLTHRKEGKEYVYRPTRPRRRVGQSAFRRVVEVFFEGSVGKALAAHLAEKPLDAAELKHLSDLIEEAKNKGE